MMRYSFTLIVFGLMCFSLFDHVEARQIAQNWPLEAHISDDYKCGEIAQLTVRGPEPRFFEGDRIEIRRLIGPVRVRLVSECEKLKQIDVIGLVGEKQVYRGRAMASKKWVLFTVPAQHAGKKGIIIGKDDELIVYQDKNLTIKGPSLNYASNWCGSGSGTNIRQPLNIRAFYKVDHFERHSLFSPNYEDFVQQNIIPPVKDYCGRVPPIIQLMMMDIQKKNQFWEILTFSVVNGKAVGKAYSPPPPWKTASLDQKKLEAHIKRMAIAQNDVKQLQGRAKKREPDVPVKAGLLGKTKHRGKNPLRIYNPTVIT